LGGKSKQSGDGMSVVREPGGKGRLALKKNPQMLKNDAQRPDEGGNQTRIERGKKKETPCRKKKKKDSITKERKEGPVRPREPNGQNKNVKKKIGKEETRGASRKEQENGKDTNKLNPNYKCAKPQGDDVRGGLKRKERKRTVKPGGRGRKGGKKWEGLKIGRSTNPDRKRTNKTEYQQVTCTNRKKGNY